MKILIVNKFLYPNGGSETYIFEIGKCLESMGHEVQYFGMEHEGREVGNRAEIYTRNTEFHGGGIKSKFAKLLMPIRIIYSKEAYRKMWRVLEDFEPDVVHFNNINFQLTPSVIEAVADYEINKGRNIQMVYTAHDSQWVCPGHLLRTPCDGRRCFDCKGEKYFNCIKNKCIHGSTARSLLGTIEAYVYKHRQTYALIDKVICPSGFMKEILETKPQLQDKCVVYHNFIPGVENKPEIDSKDKYALYFGRYSEEKGISTLLEVCKQLPNVRFIFAGSGPLENDVNALSNIENRGFLSGEPLKKLIREARFVVFTSECHENCSFTVMESISYGTPLIASATGGTPELVSDTVNGELYEAGNIDELKEKICCLWNDDIKIEKYREGCRNTHFDTVQEYCEKMVEEIYK